MAVQKKAAKEPSCPLWLATYGDLVTNMLVFFVLLVSMSEIKKEDRFLEFMQAIREAFGYIGGMEQLPLDEQLEVKNVDLRQMLIVPIRPHNFSQSPDPGLRHQHHQVTNIRRARQFVQGGKLHFNELEATLTPAVETRIVEYAQTLRGYRTQIEVRGHCSSKPVDGGAFDDHFDLSLARARTVAAVLIREGITPNRLVLVGVGANEPIATQAYTPGERRENDRVEIFELNRRVDEFGPAPADEWP